VVKNNRAMLRHYLHAVALGAVGFPWRIFASFCPGISWMILPGLARKRRHQAAVAASDVAPGEAVLREPGVTSVFLSFSFSFHAALTPLAGVTPSREHGGQRQRVPMCVSFDADFTRRCYLGPWRLRVMVGEKNT